MQNELLSKFSEGSLSENYLEKIMEDENIKIEDEIEDKEPEVLEDDSDVVDDLQDKNVENMDTEEENTEVPLVEVGTDETVSEDSEIQNVPVEEIEEVDTQEENSSPTITEEVLSFLTGKRKKQVKRVAKVKRKIKNRRII